MLCPRFARAAQLGWPNWWDNSLSGISKTANEAANLASAGAGSCRAAACWVVIGDGGSNAPGEEEEP